MRSRRFERTAIAVAAASAAGFAWLARALAWGHLTRFDESTRAALHSYADPLLTLFMRGVTLTGSQPVILAVAACAIIVLFLKRDRDCAWLILSVVAGAEIFEVVLKIQFHRQRPEPFFDTILPGSYSFPSGHALLSLCVYGVLTWVLAPRAPAAALWPIRIAGILLVLATGASRIYLGVHHPTDVIGGYLVGIFWIATLLAIRGRIPPADT